VLDLGANGSCILFRGSDEDRFCAVAVPPRSNINSNAATVAKIMIFDICPSVRCIQPFVGPSAGQRNDIHGQQHSVGHRIGVSLRIGLGPTSEMGQKAKYSQRADVFRFRPDTAAKVFLG
jgi:hypothetical protein